MRFFPPRNCGVGLVCTTLSLRKLQTQKTYMSIWDVPFLLSEFSTKMNAEGYSVLCMFIFHAVLFVFFHSWYLGLPE